MLGAFCEEPAALIKPHTTDSVVMLLPDSINLAILVFTENPGIDSICVSFSSFLQETNSNVVSTKLKSNLIPSVRIVFISIND
ncbi:hypothetical protein D3C85_1252410 [compost metagenome]